MSSPSVFLHRTGNNPRLPFASRKNQTLGKSSVSFLGNPKRRRLPVVLSMTATEEPEFEGAVKSVLPGNGISIMVYTFKLQHCSNL